jgi:hypothetical protein
MPAAALVIGAITAVLVYYFSNTYRNLQRNIALAKSSGLPVVVTPVNVYSTFWLASWFLWTPLLKALLPVSLQGIWTTYVCCHPALTSLGLAADHRSVC